MVILDASAGCALALNWPEGEKFRRLMYAGERAIAPQLYVAEIVHVFQKLVRGGRMRTDEMRRDLERALGLVDELVPMEKLFQEALSESVRLNHSSYDMFYFVLARRTAGTLFTMDQRLIKLALQNGLNCVYEDTSVKDDPWTIRLETVEGPGRAYTREELLGRG